MPALKQELYLRQVRKEIEVKNLTPKTLNSIIGYNQTAATEVKFI